MLKQQIEEQLLFVGGSTNKKIRFIMCACKVSSDWLGTWESSSSFRHAHSRLFFSMFCECYLGALLQQNISETVNLCGLVHKIEWDTLMNSNYGPGCEQMPNPSPFQYLLDNVDGGDTKTPTVVVYQSLMNEQDYKQGTKNSRTDSRVTHSPLHPVQD